MTRAPAKAFLGVGWSFPLQLEVDGSASLSEYEEDIRQAVLLILETAKGERVMRPDFGSGLHHLVFEPLNTTMIALAKHTVEQALIQWEPRIDCIQINAAVPTSNNGRLNIDIRYRIRATNNFYNLVYPFYLQEGRPSSTELGTASSIL